MTWIQTNGPWLIATALALLPTLITAFTKYPKVENWLGTIQRLLGLLSLWGHSDSPGVKLKAPLLMTPNVPGDHPSKFKSASSLVAAKLLIIAALLGGGHAKAQVWSHGPTIPLLELRLADPASGKSTTSLLQAGAGYALTAGFAQRAIGGKAWDLFDASLLAFATVGSSGGQTLDSASLAISIGTLSNLISFGFGMDLFQVYGSQQSGLLVGNVGKQNLFGLLSLSFQFAGGPYSPPTGIEEGAAGLPRANTIYW